MLYVFYFSYAFLKFFTAVCYFMCLCNCPSGTNKLKWISWLRPGCQEPNPARKKEKTPRWCIPSSQSVITCCVPLGNVWKVLLAFNWPCSPGSLPGGQSASRTSSRMTGGITPMATKTSLLTWQFLQKTRTYAKAKSTQPEHRFLFWVKCSGKQMKYLVSEYFTGFYW